MTSHRNGQADNNRKYGQLASSDLVAPMLRARVFYRHGRSVLEASSCRFRRVRWSSQARGANSNEMRS
jgi:hypothetical protein